MLRLIVFILLSVLLAQCVGCDQDAPAPGPASRTEAPPDAGALAPELSSIFQLIEQGRPNRARLLLQRYNLNHPDDGQAIFLFGLSFHVQDRFDQARIHFARALNLIPHYPPLHYFYGWCLYHLGELDASRELFRSHLKLQPDEPDSHFALGSIALAQNQLDLAREHFARTIAMYEADPADPQALGRAHGKLGETLARSGGDSNLAEARRHLTAAAELYPDDHESLYHLYRVLVSLNEADAEDARLQYEAARRRAGLPGEAPP